MAKYIFVNRFCTKQGVQNLPPIVTRFPSAVYHMPSFSEYSDTHFIRTPLSISTNPKVRSVRTHQFDPFLEVNHQCRLTVHFNKLPTMDVEPVVLEFPIIITDYPSTTIPDTSLSTDFIYTETEPSHSNGRTIVGNGGDDAVNVDLDLPEYTPRYEEPSSTTTSVV